MKPVIINADDYAFSEGVDAAIIDLAHKGRVTATTALVCAPRWKAAAIALRDAPLSAGLHLDFTNAYAPTNQGVALPVKQLIARSWSRTLSRETALKSVREQLDRFEAGMSRAPAIVDGHEHCFQFPVIRDALLDELQRRYGSAPQRPLLRSTAAQSWRGAKAAIIAALGSASLKQRAQQAGFAMSGDFAGVYDFASGSDLAQLWKQWFESLRVDTGIPIIMCHPSYMGDNKYPDDSIYSARVREAAWLSSAQFQLLTEQCQMSLVRIER